MKPIPIAVGFDQRESAVYHTFCLSVIESSSVPVMFIPLSENLLKFDCQQDGSNAFIYSRYLVPWLFGFQDVTEYDTRRRNSNMRRTDSRVRKP